MIFLLIFSSLLSAQQKLKEATPYQDIYLPHITNKEIPRYQNPHELVDLKQILSSGVETSGIKKGAIIQDIKTSQSIVAKKLTTVNHYSLADERGFLYLLNKDGETKYRVHLKYIEKASIVTTLRRPPKKYIETKKIFNTNKWDEVPPWSFSANLSTGYMNAGFIRDLVNDSAARGAFAYGLGTDLAFRFAQGFQAALALNLESASFSYSNSTAKYNTIGLGPLVRSPQFIFWEQKTRFFFSYFTNIKSDFTINSPGGGAEFPLNVNSLRIGAEFPYKNKLGEFFVGLMYQRSWIRLQDQPESVFIDSQKKPNDFYGIGIRQEFF